MGTLRSSLSNCIVYAVKRFVKEGGYLIIHKSRFGWWPHMMWSEDLRTFWEFEPEQAKKKHRFPPLIFRGKERKREL